MKNILVFLVVGVCLVTFLTGCGGEDPVAVASRVAQDWTEQSVSEISEDIGEMVTLNIPVLRSIASSVIESSVRDALDWRLSTPSKIAENRYKVFATVTAQFSVILLGTYTISADYELYIDTKNERVIDATLDLGSFDFQ